MTTSQELTVGAQELTVGLGASGLETADMVLNIGPQHPATHGVLRLRLVVDGERIVTAEPIVGYMHRAPRNCSRCATTGRSWFWPTAMTGCQVRQRARCRSGVEAMLGMEVPERATWTRTLLAELTRVLSHLMFLGSYPLSWVQSLRSSTRSGNARNFRPYWKKPQEGDFTSCSTRWAASRLTSPQAGWGESTRRSRP